MDVTEATFATEVEQASLPVLLDFWAPWCGACKMVPPIFDELTQMYQGRVRFAKVNADDDKALADRFAVRGLPTMLLLKGGEVVERVVGVNPLQTKPLLVELLGKHTEGQGAA
jgi:thioredoxin